MKVRSFGKLPSGEEAQLFILRGGRVEVEITNYGGIIASVKAPDRSGKMADIVLGYELLDGYLRDKAHFGGIIGRYANRIAHGEFTLSGRRYVLARNNGENHLHGGIKGFDRVLWQAKDTSAGRNDALRLEYASKDGEEGYPGNLKVQVVYALTETNELRIDYTAATDKDTVLNLTNHSYFNLTGDAKHDVLRHQLSLRASRFTPVNASLIPTGEIRDVSGTPFDFRKMTAIGERIDADDAQLKYGKGYDHNWVLDIEKGKAPSLAAEVFEAGSGRTLEVFTTEPGIQFYSANMLKDVRGKGGTVYQSRHALCLETQRFPDSPNHLNFPTTGLRPGEDFKSTTIFKFGIE